MWRNTGIDAITAAADAPPGKLPDTPPRGHEPDARLLFETPNLAGAKAEAQRQTFGDERMFST